MHTRNNHSILIIFSILIAVFNFSLHGKDVKALTFNPKLWGIASVDKIRYVKLMENDTGYSIENILMDSPYTAHTEADISPTKTLLPFIPVSFNGNNYFNGITATFSESHSNADIAFIKNAPDDESFIRFNYVVNEKSYAGFYLRLYERKGLPQFYSYFDATNYHYLTFYLKGTENSSDVLIRMADQKWENQGDAITFGKIKDFATLPVKANKWHRIVIPLKTDKRFDYQNCASIVFLVNSRMKGSLHIKDIRFEIKNNLASGSGKDHPPPQRKAVWVWETRRYAHDTTLWKTHLTKLKMDGFTDIFLQLLYSSNDSIQWNTFRNLIPLCSKQSIRVHALDGNPQMAFKENHPKVLSIIHAVAEYNASVPPECEFSGIHLDIEPYILKFDNPMERNKILRYYIELLRTCSSILDSLPLEFGAAIPFWFDYHWYRGKSMAHYIIDITDYIALMNYRTFAFGPNGALVHSIEEMKYAHEQNKHVFLGLETSKVQKEKYLIYTTSGKESSGISIEQPSTDAATISFFSSGKFDQKKGCTLFLDKNISSNPENVSFYGKTYDELKYLSNILNETYNNYDSFSGMAYHSLKSYLRLKRR